MGVDNLELLLIASVFAFLFYIINYLMDFWKHFII